MIEEGRNTANHNIFSVVVQQSSGICRFNGSNRSQYDNCRQNVYDDQRKPIFAEYRRREPTVDDRERCSSTDHGWLWTDFTDRHQS